ncbi:MAG: Holliday junction resolvase RuvX [Candidatus Saccharimonadales bacterium]
MALKSNPSGYLLGLDVGDKRIGVAVASAIARLPQPLDMIASGDGALQQITAIITQENITLLVIGLPRNMKGEETAQSAKIRNFATELSTVTPVPIAFADESLSSVRADDLGRHNTFKNVSSDSLAACFILEEYFLTNDHPYQGVTFK